ncbi:FeoA domain-containing protein [uncultured Campylobacter sp.]|uniref:FeoA family protein n=1 Tax=uncultured Campylobacter sp. TaxID=218934 RepID=UPI0025DBFF51|nr:FeoA domain-containing protein [uncultured Campylobacter sp.]
MNLGSAQAGILYKIKELKAEGKLLQKLLDMGFINGAVVEAVRLAPLLDPIEFKIQDCLISLRKSEATLVEVEVCK